MTCPCPFLSCSAETYYKLKQVDFNVRVTVTLRFFFFNIRTSWNIIDEHVRNTERWVKGSSAVGIQSEWQIGVAGGVTG